MKNKIKPFALIWILLICILPFFKNLNPFITLTLSILPLIISENWKKLFPPISFIIVFIFTYLLLKNNGNNNFVGLFNHLLLPILCIQYMKGIDLKQLNYFRIGIIILYLTNCCIAITEYNLHINFLSYDLSYFDRFRATGLWVHPLFNALIQCICMLFILLSDLRKDLKIILYAIGLYTIFTFDARAATIMLIASSSYILFKQGIFSGKKIVFVFILIITCKIFYNFLSESGLGGKMLNLSTETIKDDGSTQARFIAIEVFFDRTWNELFTGVVNKEKLFSKYGLIAIENSFVDFTLSYGLITSISYFFLYTKSLNKLLSKTLNYKIKYLIIGTFLIVGITSTALTEYFIWIAFITFYYGFMPYSQIKK